MSTGFLITNLTNKLKYVNEVVNQHFLKKLYIYVVVNNQANLCNTEWVSKQILDIYSLSANHFPNLDVRIILNELKLQDKKACRVRDYDIDVVILPKNYNERKINDIKNANKNLCIVFTDDECVEEPIYNKFGHLKIYQNVILGGTFDRLHNGHKILLSDALLRCSKKITVGVTDESMIKGKKLSELIEPSGKRVEEVKQFIKEVDSTVDYEVVLINDIYGPSKSDPDLNLIVVSSETQKGAIKVNEMRKLNHLNELDIHVVNLVDGTIQNDEEEQKLSSSNYRLRLLGCYLKIPEPKPNLSPKPYKIGLTGGVASGKSSICDYLKRLGAGTVDCDKIAHELYKPKTDIYYKLIALFGKTIVSDNEEINRKELGGIVFKNPEKLQQLNGLLWPAILETAMIECERLYNEENKNIVVLEAAVLLKANWDEIVHEVWGAIIPENEAVARLKSRNHLSEDEAKLRINAQTSNLEIVSRSNIIFCSLWSYEFTQKQVNKAWESVQSFIKN